jgi:hypothetical protein
MITVKVMNLQYILCRKGQSTIFAFAALPFQEFDHPQRFERMSLQTLRPINPISIKRAFRANDFSVPSDFGFFVLEQVVVAIAETNSSVNSLPIATIAPGGPFTGMTRSCPATEFVLKLSGLFVVGFFGGTGFVVIGPAPNNGVEFANQPCLRATAVITDHLFELSQMAFLRFLTGSDQGLETGLTPVGSGFVSAHVILSDVEPQKIKPGLTLLVFVEGVNNAGFVGVELQSYLAQPRFRLCLDLMKLVKVVM